MSKILKIFLILNFLALMSIFKNLKISTSNTLSNSNRKKIEKEIDMTIDKNTKIFKAKKISLIGSTEHEIFAFNYLNKWIFTLKHLKNENNYPIIYLDNGAKDPITRGCDIFIPGVNLYKNKIEKKFKKNEIVSVFIIDYGIFAIAESLIDFDELDKKGVGFKVLSFEKDELDRM